MKRLVFAMSALALACAATTAARADFAVARFHDGWCRPWVDTAYKPFEGKYLWWRHHHHVHFKLVTWASAEKHVKWAIKHHRCTGGW